MNVDLIRAEWTKLRSLRSTGWSLLATVAVSLGITALATGAYVGRYDQLADGDRAQMHADAIGLILQPAASFGGISVAVLGVMVIAGEYSTGMIRSSLLAVPRRTPLLAAKAAVFATAVFVIGELTAIAVFLLGHAIVARRVEVTLGDPAVRRAVAGFGLYLSVLGLLALAIGALIRHVAGAIATVLGLILGLPLLLALVPGSFAERVGYYLPTQAGTQLIGSGRWPSGNLSPWAGFGVLCLQTVVLLGLAGYLLRRRDA